MLYVKNLHKSYMTGKKEYPVLKGVSFQIAKGEFVAVMGPSGSGKSTLLNCISCYIPFDKGEITLGGTKLVNLSEAELAKVRNEKLGFVFQDFMLLDGLTVRENILVPRIIQGKVDREAEAFADQLMHLFGISISAISTRRRSPAVRNSAPPSPEVLSTIRTSSLRMSRPEIWTASPAGPSSSLLSTPKK